MAGRLALRQEGEWWHAYFAEQDTMEDALLLGSLRIALANVPEIKVAFMETMKLAVTVLLKDAIGADISHWDDPQPAPESERSGHA